MTKYTQKQLKSMVADGMAIDVTYAGDCSAIPEDYRKVGYSQGVYGTNGLLMVGLKTGKMYVVATRSTSIYVF